MKHFIIGSLFLLVASIASAQTGDSVEVRMDQSIPPFEILKGVRIPNASVVKEALMRSGLFEVCEKQGFDQLERDILFIYTAKYPFEEYMNKEFKDDSGRKYIDVFSEKNLRDFWIRAREVIKEDIKVSTEELEE